MIVRENKMPQEIKIETVQNALRHTLKSALNQSNLPSAKETAVLSLSLLTFVNTCVGSRVEAATVNLTGTITQQVMIEVNDDSTVIDMTNGATTSQNLSVAANVPFTIAIDSANNLKMVTDDDIVNYSFNIQDALDNVILAAQGTSKTNQNVSGTWKLNITPEGIDGSTHNGTYEDTITITIAAAS